MKEEFLKPEIVIELFTAEDVVLTSGTGDESDKIPM